MKKIRLLFYWLIILTAFNSLTTMAAPYKFVPYQITQPDKTMDSFSADNASVIWIENAKKHYSIKDTIKHPTLKSRINKQSNPSSKLIDKLAPKRSLLEKPSIGSGEEVKSNSEISNMSLKTLPSPVSDMNNLMIYVRFAGETEFDTTRAHYDSISSSLTGESMLTYFEEVSYNQTTINSYHYPPCPNPSTSNLSFQDIKSRNYYQEFDSITNLNGYDGYQELRIRFDSLFYRAVNWINTNHPIDPSVNIDLDNNGIIDNISFMIRGTSTGGFRSHRAGVAQTDITINGKNASGYLLLMEDASTCQILSHEMFHVLSAPDLYHEGYTLSISPVGGWGLMDNHLDSILLLHPSAYEKWKYGKWIDSIPEINTSGVYTLNPLISPTNNCFKIASPNSLTEYYVVEYRKAEPGTYEESLLGEGLLVYRINPLFRGNSGFDNVTIFDEVYLYRPDATTLLNGDLNNAHFSLETGRTMINDTTNPSGFLHDGSLGGLNISNITSAGATISFTVTIPDDEISIQNQSLNPAYTSQGDLISLTCDHSYTGSSTSILSPDVAYYFSEDTILDLGTDILIGTDESSLSASITSETEGATYQLPAVLAPGTYYILFVGDHLNEVIESSEVNNISYAKLTICNESISLPYVQDFESSTFPACWSQETFASDGGWLLGDTSAFNYPFNSIEHTNFIATLDDNTNMNKLKDRLITPLFDISGTFLCNISFDFNFLDYSGPTWQESFIFEASYDQGLTWILVDSLTGAYGWQTYEQIILTNNQTDVMFSFKYSDHAVKVFGAAIDNFSVVDTYGDLFIQNQTLSTNYASQGDLINVSCEQVYDYPVATLLPTVGYYLSSDTLFDIGTDIFLGANESSLSTTVSFELEDTTIQLPTVLAPGVYYMLFVADHLNEVSEFVEFNNFAYQKLTICNENISLPYTQDFESSAFPACWSQETMASDGGWLLGDATSFTLPFNLSGHTNFIATMDDFTNMNKLNDRLITPLFDLTGIYTYNVSFDFFFADFSGSSWQESFIFEASYDYGSTWILIDSMSGQYYWQTYEHYVTNNTESHVMFSFKYSDEGVQVYGAGIDNFSIVDMYGDLAIQNETLNTNYATQGDNISISCEQTYADQVTSLYPSVGYYLSNDTLFDNGIDQFLGANESSLSASISFELEDTTLQLPAVIAPGTYYILFVADHLNEVSESNELNNIAYQEIKICNESGTLPYTQDFESGAFPACWEQETLSADGGWLLGDSTSLSVTSFSFPEHSDFLATVDWPNHYNKISDRLFTPLLDLSGVQSYTLSFDFFFRNHNGPTWQESLTLEASYDQGASWVHLDSLQGQYYQWQTFEDSISNNTHSSVIFSIKYSDHGVQVYGAAIDNFSVQATAISNNMILSSANTNASCNGNSDGSIDLTVSGGTSPYFFSWSNGETSEDLTNIGVGVYTVTVTDDQSATESITITITEPTLLNVFTLLSDYSGYSVSSNGASDGSIDLTITGGSAPYSFAWSTGETSEDISNLGIGQYTVTVTDDAGCALIQEVVLVPHPSNNPRLPLIEHFTSGSSSCYYCCTSEQAFQNAITQTATECAVIRYPSYFLEDGYQTLEGEQRYTYYNVQGIPNASLNGGAPTHSNNITDTLISNSFQSDTSNFYMQVMMQVTGNQVDVTVDITSSVGFNEPSAVLQIAIVENETFGNVTCSQVNSSLFMMKKLLPNENGTSLGQLNAGTTYTYTQSYTFPASNTVEEFTDLSVVAFIQNNTSHTVYQSAKSVNQYNSIIVNGAVNNTTCGNDGSIDITVTGGTAPYSYLWSNGATNEDLSNIGAGNYCLTVTDSTMSTATICQTITGPNEIMAAATLSDYLGYSVSANGASDGSIDLTINGGTPPFSYTWSNGATTEDISMLTAGTYDVTIIDVNACQTISTLTLTEPQPIATSDLFFSEYIEGSGNNKSIEIYNPTATAVNLDDFIIKLATNGNGWSVQYNFPAGSILNPQDVWVLSNDQADPWVQSLANATLGYPSVVHFNGDDAIGLFQIVGTNHLVIDQIGNELLDPGSAWDVAGYSYGTKDHTLIRKSSITTGNSNWTASAGTTIANSEWEVYVQNEFSYLGWHINNVTAIQLTQSSVNNSCYGDTNGSINISVSGGTSPYTFLWSNGASSEDLTNVGAGVYTLTVTDAQAATESVTVTITEPDVLDIIEMGASPLCHGDSTGYVNISITGGTAPYTFMWSNGTTAQNLTGISVGNYFITTTDANGCTKAEGYGIAQPAELVLSGSIIDESAAGANDGIVDITVYGGTTPYTFLWSNGSTNEDLSGLTVGSYTVSVSDANNCLTVATYDVQGTMISGPGWQATNTGNVHTILLQSSIPVTIDGIQISNGDYIGVFYDSSSTEVCGGFDVWTGQNLALSTYGNDTLTNGKDGFAEGETFQWKIWRASDGLTFAADADYIAPPLMPNTSTFANLGLSGLNSLMVSSYDQQDINIQQGWSLISTYIDPTEANIDSICAPIISQVIIVKNDNGDIYWPQYAVNSINNIIIGEGYQIKMISSQIMTVTGLAVQPETTQLGIPQDWSILGYLRQSPAAMESVLSSIENDIIIVKNSLGLSYWPLYNINSIGNMNPGEGYQIKMQSSRIFTYPANTATLAKVAIQPSLTNHFVAPKITESNMTVGIITTDLLAGSEIGVFNQSGLLVGAAVCEGDFTSITLWGDDATTSKIDGLLANEEFIVNIWDGNKTSIGAITWTEGTARFEINQIAVGKLNAIDRIETAAIELFQNTPNPYRNSTEFSFYLPAQTHVELRILNILGEEIETIISSELEMGLHKLNYNNAGLNSGTYYYRLSTPEFSQTKKMMILK